MARYPSSSHGKSRKRNAAYIVWTLVIVAAIVLIYSYKHFDKNEQEPAATAQTNAPAAEQIKTESEQEPNLPGLSEVQEQPAQEYAGEPGSGVDGLIAEAMACINARPAGIIEAREILNDVLKQPMSKEQLAFVKDQLSQLADKWLFSQTIFPQDSLCGSYKVESGDQLRTIAREYKVPWDILAEINKIRPESLQAGSTIKVINGPFHARVYRLEFRMDLYLRNRFVRSFMVGIGKPGRETPTGLWQVKPGGRMKRPTWRDPDTGRIYHADDPDYPLGSRWVELEGIEGDAVGVTGIAFHGTNDPNMIGMAGSRGCIRLHNGDAVLIYNLLMPGFSRVEVVE